MSAPRLRVLVVAAHDDDAKFAVRVLEDNGDRAETCGDVPEALARLSQESFDLALISLSMPRGDGLALVHHLRALYPDLDVVVMASAEEVEEAASAMALGVHGTVVTPLTGDDVLTAADRARERRVLLAERAGLHAKVAASLKRTETYARCAAFVAEAEPEGMARQVLEACEAEVPSDARGLFLGDASTPDRYFRMSLAGDEDKLPDALTDKDLHHVSADESVGELGEQVFLVLRNGDQYLGAVVLQRADDTPLAVEQSEALEVIARLASAALTAARRVDAIARGGIKDPETGAYTFAYFGDVAGREIERAVRHQGTFALLTVQHGGLGDNRDELGAADLTRMRKILTQAELASVRVSDVVARVDDGEYYLLLPETGLLGALATRRRILDQLQQSYKDEPLDSALKDVLEPKALSVGVGVSIFPSDGSDLGELLKLSRKRAERARTGEWQRLELEEKSFWDAVDVLIQQPVSDIPDDVLGAHAKMPPSLVARVATAMIQDAAREGVAGTLYLAGDHELAQLVMRAVDASDGLSLRTWILGPAASVRDPAARVRIPLTDGRLTQMALILCMTERGGYCLAAQRDGEGQLNAFHSSDLDLVEGLVSRLQNTYHLQPELR